MDGANLDLPRSFFGLGPAKRAIIDSGTTLAYLPADIYKQVFEKVGSETNKITDL